MWALQGLLRTSSRSIPVSPLLVVWSSYAARTCMPWGVRGRVSFTEEREEPKKTGEYEEMRAEMEKEEEVVVVVKEGKEGSEKDEESLFGVKARKLPLELQGQYIKSLDPKVMEQYPERVRAALSLQNANNMEINHWRIHNAVERFQRREGDTGSTEVQIATLTERIKYLDKHFEKHHKDYHTRRGYQRLVTRRRQMMKYLRRKNIVQYKRVITELGLEDVVAQLQEKATQ